jgi:hypothetical protein
VFLSKHRADRFFLWWLFLHRRLRPRQRGLLAFACKRLLLLPGGSLPKSVVRFYPSNLKKFFNLFVSAISPALDAEYALACGQPITPHSEAMMTILPPPARRIPASTFPVSTQIVFTFYCFRILLCFSRNTVPIGFCCGGFSSTAGYVPGNEAYLLSHVSDFCSFLVVPCQKVLFVFIRATRKKSFNLFLSKAFRLRFKA